jgi:DNA-binding NtrC family response regulator
MFLRRHAESGGGGAPRITEEAMELLLRIPWPGNLRQLDNIVRRAYAIMIADPGAAASPATLSRRHVEQALGYEPQPEARGLVAACGGRPARSWMRRSAEKRRVVGCRSI